jgi:hypothetical protein
MRSWVDFLALKELDPLADLLSKTVKSAESPIANSPSEFIERVAPMAALALRDTHCYQVSIKNVCLG